MRKLLSIGLALAVWSLVAGTACGETFTLTDHSTLDGELVVGSANEKGIILRLADGSYSERVMWEKFSQEDLKNLAKNAKFARFVQPLIIEDEPVIEKQKKPRPAVVIKPVETRLKTPEDPALIGGFFTSTVGWFILLALYAANFWAAYEVAIFRAQPVGLVCGIAAVAPAITQMIFLGMPTRMPKEAAAGGEAAGGAPGDVGAPEAEKLGANLKIAYATPETEVNVPTEAPVTVFKRGEFMFNRRFFETRFSNFFGMVRRDKDKASTLLIKTSRGEYNATRITRIAAGDMHIEIHKGTASEEVAVSFVEIQEVQLKQGH